MRTSGRITSAKGYKIFVTSDKGCLVIVKFFGTFVSSSNDDWHQDSGDKLWLHATRLKGPNQPPIMYNKTIKITIKVQGR